MPKTPKKVTEEVMENLVALLDTSPLVTIGALSKRSGIPRDQLVKHVESLRLEGYIEKGDRIVPTEKGAELGCKIVRKHRLLERFFHDIVGMNKGRVHREACRLEHELSDEGEAALCRYLEHPQNCPDDERPIPVCDMDVDSCEDCKSGKIGHSRAMLVPLTEIEPGKSARVRFIRGGRNAVHRLRDMGLVTNAKVTVLKRAPFSGPVEIIVCSTKLAIGRNIAEKVFVEAC